LNLISTTTPFELDLVKPPTWFALAAILTIALDRCRRDEGGDRSGTPAIEASLSYSAETR
jgi:hypothetical protein